MTELAALIECDTCHGSIAKLAEKCPHCGAPNGWRHPKIEAFYKDLPTIGTAQRFSVWSDKTAVWGETAPKTMLWAQVFVWTSMVFGVLLSLVFAWWAVFVIALVGGAVQAAAQGKKTFRADLAAETWFSNDDKFWWPVIEKLRPPASPDSLKP